MTSSANLGLAITFMASLMLMGMAGLPFALFEADHPSPHLVAGLRLTLVGVLALAVGIVTHFKCPRKHKPTKADFGVWLTFVGLAVVGVNGTLTYALYFLDDRVAMAVMLVAIGSVFIARHPANAYAWAAAFLAIAGTFLLATCSTGKEQINPAGVLFAAIGGTAQGIMFFKKDLMPKNFDPGIALGSAFLVGGLSMTALAASSAPVMQSLVESPTLLMGTFVSAIMTVIGWLILVYGAELMSGAQKTGAAAFEPIGAAIAQFIRNGVPVSGEVFGVAFLVASAAIAILVDNRHVKAVMRPT